MRLARPDIGSERGVVMPTVIVTTLVVMTLTVAAITAAKGDLGTSRQSVSGDRAREVAEIGAQRYLFYLARNEESWQSCTAVDSRGGVSQKWSGTGPDPRSWRELQTTGREQLSYAIELLPAEGHTACDPADPEGSMLDAGGNLRIRSTGQIATAEGTRSVKRSVVATFRRRSFTDYAYFTDYETTSPNLYYSWLHAPFYGPNSPSLYSLVANLVMLDYPSRTYSYGPPIKQWAQDECTLYRRDGRGQGDGWWDYINYYSSSGANYLYYDAPINCEEPMLTSYESIQGPLHTNDELTLCGYPAIGRGPQDKIETVAPGSEGWQPGRGGNCEWAYADMRGTPVPDADPLSLPTSVTGLKRHAQDGGYVFLGPTRIELGASQLTVTNAGLSPTTKVMAYPSNGLVYVDSLATQCKLGTYEPMDPFDGDLYRWYHLLLDLSVAGTPNWAQGNNASYRANCGDVQVSGTSGEDLTIVSEKDIGIAAYGDSGEVSFGSDDDSMLGLVANDFVMINQPVVRRAQRSGDYGYGWYCSTSPSYPMPYYLHIRAAIMALNHSFMLESYDCGDQLGYVDIEGSVAQRFRGPLGLNNDRLCGVGCVFEDPEWWNGYEYGQVSPQDDVTSGYYAQFRYDDRLASWSPPFFPTPIAGD